MAALRADLGAEVHGDAGARDDDARLAYWMLAATRPWPAVATATLQALSDAHRDGVDDPTVWRQLRKAAVALGDDADDEVRRFGSMGEAAAWPLASSAAGLTDLLRSICALRAAQAATATGWTREDEAEAHAKLNVIAQGDGTTPPAREAIPGLFRAAHPVLGQRFGAQLAAANAAFTGFRREVAAWIAGAGG